MYTRNAKATLVSIFILLLCIAIPTTSARRGEISRKEVTAIPSQPIPLQCGNLVSDTIDFTGEVHQYTFNGQASQKVTLTASASGFPFQVTATVKIFLPSGGVLDMFNANGQRQLTLLETGIYVIQVSASNLVSTGTYGLGLECLLPTSSVDQPLVCGSLYAGSIDASAKVDQRTFSGQANQKVTLTFGAGGFPFQVTATATVFSPTAMEVITFNANSQQQLMLPESGTYVIQVRASNFVSTGTYSLGLECLLPTSPVDQALVCGSLYAGTIDAVAKVDQFTFFGQANDKVTLTLGAGNFPFQVTATATVFSPTIMEVITFNANSQQQLMLPESGTYVIQVRASNFVSTGTYSLGLECLLPTSPVDQALVCGSLYAGTIDASAKVDQLTFSGQANQNVTLTLGAGGFPFQVTATATVFSPTGGEVIRFNANSQQQLMLPESGTYVIQVRASNFVSTGTYSLGLECLLPPSPVDPLVCGSLYAGTIDASAKVDQLTFSGQANQKVTLTFGAGGFPFQVTATATVFSPTGVEVIRFNANSQQQLMLPESGTYVIQVRASNFVSTGTYSLGLECLLPTSPVDQALVCGSLFAGTIDASAKVDQITFSGQANQKVTLTFGAAGFPFQVTATATVFSPTAMEVITFNANSQQQLMLPESGTYVIQIRTSNFVSTGTYSLGLECLLPTSPVDANLICGGLEPNRPISAVAQVDQITFNGQANQNVTLTLAANGFPFQVTATATVFSPTGMLLETFNANSQKQMVLQECGTYVVQVRASNLVSTGTYSLGLQCIAPPSVTVTLDRLNTMVGASDNMTVAINPAQSTNTVVMLSSSNTAIATVPTSVTIPANATSATFQVMGVAAGLATITATLPGSLGCVMATVTVTPTPAQIEIIPPTPTTNDSIAVRIFGDWPNACVPLNPMHSIANNEIRIATTNPGQICSQVISPWTHNRQIGMLPAGNYQVIVTYNGSEIGRKSFTVNNLVPTLTSLNPNSVQAGGPSFTLTVNGTNFVSGSVVRWNGSDKMTTFVSATQLMAMITAADIAAPGGMASVTVFNPLPGGGLSNALPFTINPPTSTRMVQVMDASGNAGGQVMVGIELISQGDENALGFSLTFNPAILKNPQAVLGSHAAGAMLNTNGSQANQGRLGIALSLSTGQVFPAGNRQIVVVTFMVDASAMAGTTPVGFGDQPISREVVGVSANPLATTWKPGIVTISTGYEADVSPRPNGNNDGTVTIADWVQCGRFVAMLDTPSTGAGGEFQRADTAPLTTKGDGKLTVADWVQCGRYAARLDPAMAAAGPTAPAPMGTVAANSKLKGKGMEVPVSRWLRVINGGTGEGRTLTMIVELDATGDENALGFSMSFDPAAWRFVSANPAESTSRATAHVNVNEAGKGKIGVLLALSPGEVFSAGTHQLLALSFVPIALDRVGADSFKFSDAPILREAADVNAEPLPIKYAPDSATGRARVDAIVSAASFDNIELAAESIATIFGDGLSGEAQLAVTSPLPTEMAGVSVTVEDSKGVRRPSPLFFVSPTQINYQIPPGTAPGLAAIIVDSPTGIATTTAQIENIAPGLFSANASGKGAAAVLLRVKSDGTQVFESVTRYDSAQKMFFAQPIEIGSEGDQLFLILFGTGFRFRSDLSSVSATIGGINSEVLFVGPQGDFTGIDQVNLRLPSELAGRGDLDVRLIVDGKPSNTVQINIK